MLSTLNPVTTPQNSGILSSRIQPYTSMQSKRNTKKVEINTGQPLDVTQWGFLKSSKNRQSPLYSHNSTIVKEPTKRYPDELPFISL